MTLDKNWTKNDIYTFFLILYLICLPLNAIHLGAWGSALKVMAIFPILAAFIGRGRMHMSIPLFCWLGFTVFAALSVFWSRSASDSMSRTVSYALLFLLLLSASMASPEEKEIGKIKMALVWSSRLTAVVLFIFGEYYYGRLWLTGDIAEDPNYICAYFAFGVIFAVQRLIERTSLSRRLLGLAELLVYLFLVLSTGSRGGLLAIVAAIAVYLMTASNRDGAWYRKLLFFAIILVAFIVLMSTLSDVLIDRFTVENVENSGGSGRLDIWKNGWDLFLSAPLPYQLFGYGTASVLACFGEFGYRPVSVMHNIFLETLVELGVVGLTFYLVAIVSFAVYAVRMKDKFCVSVLACMVVLSLSTSLYTFKPYFNVMMYVILCINMKANATEAAVLETQYEE